MLLVEIERGRMHLGVLLVWIGSVVSLIYGIRNIAGDGNTWLGIFLIVLAVFLFMISREAGKIARGE